ncbi:alpha/beta fold hydrolase [Streptomyces sp. NBC_01236]|uniref:alpha/beta fold hydrolase n=1 Tax=Streptomyces sp. NBC_01236 TaxID=2903789 RepID=UPI003FA35A21
MVPVLLRGVLRRRTTEHRQRVHREPEAPSLTVTTQAQRSPALRASGPRIAFPPGLKTGIPCEEQGMDQYADDLAELIETLNLNDVILVGHSTGGGEVARYIGRHGTARVAKAVLLGAVPPLMLKTDANPEGTPIDAFDGIRAGVEADRSQFYWDLSEAFYGYNRPGATESEGVRRAFWLWSMQVGLKGAYDCIKQFSETDFTEDLARIDVPTLVAHGDGDQIVPIAAAALKMAQLVKDATLKVYPGAPHGLVGEFEEAFNADLLDFIR